MKRRTGAVAMVIVGSSVAIACASDPKGAAEPSMVSKSEPNARPEPESVPPTAPDPSAVPPVVEAQPAPAVESGTPRSANDGGVDPLARGSEGSVAFGTGTLSTGFGPGGDPGAWGRKRDMHAADAGTMNGGLSTDQISRVVLGHVNAVHACYSAEAKRQPDLQGSVQLSWMIDPAGNVDSVKVVASTLANRNLETCILHQVRKWHFPKSAAPSSVASYPFKFGVR